MRWYRRLVWPFPRASEWPDRLPPTVPGREPVIFHCPSCRQPVGQRETTCPSCGDRLL